MVYKIVQTAADGWPPLEGANQLPKVVEGDQFTDGVAETDPANRAA